MNKYIVLISVFWSTIQTREHATNPLVIIYLRILRGIFWEVILWNTDCPQCLYSSKYFASLGSWEARMLDPLIETLWYLNDLNYQEQENARTVTAHFVVGNKLSFIPDTLIFCIRKLSNWIKRTVFRFNKE